MSVLHNLEAGVKITPCFSTIVEAYDFIICDIWGVLHNGIAAFSSANEALKLSRKSRKTVILLSNAPRPNPDIAVQLNALGISPDAYDAIVTSGDITQDLLRQRVGQSVYLLGPERDLPVLDSIGIQSVPLQKADYVLCTGLFNDEAETPDDYKTLLNEMIEARLPMLCANPDLVVERGKTLIYCAGALAEAYIKLGGNVQFIGKPFKIAYDYTFQAYFKLHQKMPDKAKTIAIGDAIRTDVKGACQYGISSLFLAAGIHSHELLNTQFNLDSARLNAFITQQDFQPNFISKNLVWSL